MSTATAYKDLFEYEELDKIHGEPNYIKLKTLHDQLKANAASVPSELGGGANGHLGIVLTALQYSHISLVPFVRPLHPGPLVVPDGATSGAIEIMKYTHDHALGLFQKTQAVEKTLIQQLSKAIDTSYLQELRNQITGLLQLPLSDIIQHLKLNYGKVQATEYKKQYQDLIDYRYNTDKPIDQLYNKIQDFNDLAEATGLPQSASQSLHMGTEMIKNCGTLTDSLKDWNRTPVQDKTWNNFKRHFREAQKQYRDTLPSTIQDPQHQANLIAQQVTSNLLQQMYQEEETAQEPAQPSQEVTQHTANAVLHDSTLQNLYTQMRNLTQTVNSMQIQGNNQHYFQNNGSQQNQQQQQNSNNNNNYYRGGRRNTRGGGRRNDRGGRGGNPFENTRRGPMPRKYCWSHGCCAHNGYECERRAHGHLMNATFNNRMGGNNANCNSQQQQQQQQQGYQQNQSHQQQQPVQQYMPQHQHNQYMAQQNPPQMQQQFIPQQGTMLPYSQNPPPPPNRNGVPPF